MEIYHSLIYANKVNDPPNAGPAIVPVLLCAPNETVANKELKNIAMGKFPASLGYCDIEIRIQVLDKNVVLDFLERMKHKTFKEDDMVLESIILD